jgi:cytochrome c
MCAGAIAAFGFAGAQQSERGTPAATAQDTPAAPKETLGRALVFTKTAGFRHDSIPDGIACLREILAEKLDVDATEDASVFNADNLSRYKVVVFLSTTGDILNETEQKAFEGFIRAGGGYAGVHAAADTEHTWPWYGQLVGSYFKTHPDIQPARIRIEDRTHPSTVMLPADWHRTDEWYVYTSNPRGRVRVLANLDTTTIRGAHMGDDHPIAWFHLFEGGRSWYTGGGHTKESFSEPLFREHLKGGILWAAGLAEPPVGDAPAGREATPPDGTVNEDKTRQSPAPPTPRTTPPHG